MPAFEDIFSDIKNQVVTLAQTEVKYYADQATKETNTFLESSKDKLKEWSEKLIAGKIDKDEFAWLLNSQQALGQMKILTQAGLAQIKIDTFTSGVKKIVTDSLLKLADKLI